MKVAVWDTYVKRTDGKIMHFDILVSSATTEQQVIAFGKVYLSRKGLASVVLSSKECKFCHMEKAPEAVARSIVQNGFHILELENCG